MIKRYFPSHSRSPSPEAPFVMVGEIVHQYSTGTQYEHVYSDDPKSDIPPLLANRNFSLKSKYRPTTVKNGVECVIMPQRKFDDTRMVCLLIPIANVMTKIGDRQLIMAIEELNKMTLQKIASF